MTIKIGETETGSPINTYQVSELISILQRYPAHTPVVIHLLTEEELDDDDIEPTHAPILDISFSEKDAVDPDSFSAVILTVPALPREDYEDEFDIDDDENYENEDNKNEDDENEDDENEDDENEDDENEDDENEE